MSETINKFLDTHSSREFFAAYRNRKIVVDVNELCSAIVHYLDMGARVLEESPEIHLLAGIQEGGIKVESLKLLQDALRSQQTQQMVEKAVNVPAIRNSHMKLAWGVGFALAALTQNNQEES